MVDIIHFFLHLDQYLSTWFVEYGPWIYLILFLIVFAETGLVATPFLPGDSLLFAVGAMTSLHQGIDFTLISCLLVLAAFLGDNVNYRVGRWLGPQVFSREKSLLMNPKHLRSTQRFYEKYGAQTVVIARFMPIVRTFAPFVAGVGKMPFSRFLAYSVFGAVLWTQIFLWAGRLFGNLPAVKTHFHIVIIAVIILSVLPIIYGWYRHQQEKKREGLPESRLYQDV